MIRLAPSLAVGYRHILAPKDGLAYIATLATKVGAPRPNGRFTNMTSCRVLPVFSEAATHWRKASCSGKYLLIMR